MQEYAAPAFLSLTTKSTPDLGGYSCDLKPIPEVAGEGSWGRLWIDAEGVNCPSPSQCGKYGVIDPTSPDQINEAYIIINYTFDSQGKMQLADPGFETTSSLVLREMEPPGPSSQIVDWFYPVLQCSFEPVAE